MKYKDSGVNIDRANRAKAAIASHVQSTWGAEVLSTTGAFGGLFAPGGSYREPVMVSSIDGVGTKVMVAAMADRFDTVGRDLVNHCVNDILVQGATPLFFLDYLASAELDPERVSRIVGGMAAACRENNCALIGGETAEMPGVYRGEDFDLAGCIVGIVEKTEIIDGGGIAPGDVVFALPSTGLHTNGYSLARHVFFERLKLGIGDRVPALGCTVGDELLRVHASYLAPVRKIMQSAGIKGMAHVTGGGVLENLPRILPASCGARIEKGTWPVPPVFTFLAKEGAIDASEMFRTFNMGLGMVLVVDPSDADEVVAAADIHRVGEITSGERKVTLS
ncbi:MAG: phosphoribosylformylglycinamidine cyclo-ligase [Candidatus Krumholzibacteriia bacterium]